MRGEGIEKFEVFTGFLDVIWGNTGVVTIFWEHFGDWTVERFEVTSGFEIFFKKIKEFVVVGRIGSGVFYEKDTGKLEGFG